MGETKLMAEVCRTKSDVEAVGTIKSAGYNDAAVPHVHEVCLTTNSFDISISDSKESRDKPDHTVMMKEYDEAYERFKEECLKEQNKCGQPKEEQFSFYSPTTSIFFSLPLPLSKMQFLQIATEIYHVVSLVLAPFGWSDDVLNRVDKQAMEREHLSVFHVVLSVVSELIYEKHQVNESIMAVSAHHFVEEVKDSECIKMANSINAILDEVYHPSRFVEVPNISYGDVRELCHNLQHKIANSVKDRAPWVRPVECNRFNKNNSNKEKSDAEGWSFLYPVTIYELGFLPTRRMTQKKSTLCLKTHVAAIADAVMVLVDYTRLSGAGFRALIDCVDSISRDEDFKKNLMEAFKPLSVFVHQEEAIQEKPLTKEVEARFRKHVVEGNSCKSVGRFVESIKWYHQALATIPIFHSEVSPVLLNIAFCLRELNHHAKAVQYCRTVIQLRPFHSEAYSVKAEVEEKNMGCSDPRRILRDYLTAFTIDGSIADSQAKDVERLAKMVGCAYGRKAYDNRFLTPSHHCLPSLWLIESYMHSFYFDVDCRIQTSLQHQSNTFVYSSADSDSKLRHLVWLKKQKMYVEAFEMCKCLCRDLQGSPGNWSSEEQAIVYNLMATFAYLSGNLPMALENIECSIQCNDQLVNSFIKKAGILAEAGELVEASQCFDHAIALQPCCMDIYLHRGQLRLLQDDLRGAVQDLSRCLSEARSSLPIAYISHALALYKMGQKQDSWEAFQLAQSQFPDSSEVCLFFGEALADHGDFVGAMAHFKRAFELCPSCPLAFLNAGRAFLSMNEPSRARIHFEEALRVDERCSTAHLDLAQLYFAQGNTQEAFDHFDRAVEYARFLSEMEEVYTSRVMAEEQLEIARRLGVELRHLIK